MNVRAGLVYELCSNHIRKKSLIEIIWFSGLHENILDFNKMKEIIPILEEDLGFLDMPIDESHVKYFKKNKNYLENYLLDNHVKYNGKVIKLDNQRLKMDLVHYNEEIKLGNEFIRLWTKTIIDEEIHGSGSKYHLCHSNYSENYEEFIKNLDIYYKRVNKIYNAIAVVEAFSLYKIPGKVDISIKKYNKKSKGHVAEKKVIKLLENLGFSISTSTRDTKRISFNLTLSGKPDGYIINCPIKSFNGAYIEIKYKPYEKMRYSDNYQIYSYYGIFEKPILLINYWKNKLEYRFFKTAELESHWKSIKRRLRVNCRKIYNLINVSDVDSFDRLYSALENDKINFT